MTNPTNAHLKIVPDAAALALTATEIFVQAAQKNIATHGRFTVALSGGSTPKAMFALLATEPYRSAVAWEKIYFFWGDERCVPPDHQDSNYRMTHETLLAHVPVPAQNIFRMQGEIEPVAAAAAYEQQLQTFFQTSEIPQLDLVFLGMGADGHTASLFPATTALHAAADKIAVANYVAKFQTYRLTLTTTLINHAAEIVFLVGGADKAATLHDVLRGAYQPEIYPSQLIQPISGTLQWIVEAAAAAQLQRA